MSKWKITPRALRMAWKMAGTILPRHKVSRRDANLLLLLTSILSLEDLRESGCLTWGDPGMPPADLRFKGRRVIVSHDPGDRWVLKTSHSPSEIDRAGEKVEQIITSYGMDAEEAGTLYTALPCLGLHAIQGHLVWKKEPPFPELG